MILGVNLSGRGCLNLRHGGDTSSGSGSSGSAGKGEGTKLLNGDSRQNHGAQERKVGEEKEGNGSLGLSASTLGALSDLVVVNVLHVAARVASDGGGKSGTTGEGESPRDEVNQENDNGEGKSLNKVGEDGVEHTEKDGPCATETGVRDLGVVVSLLVGGGERTGQTKNDGGEHENQSTENEIGDLDHCCSSVVLTGKGVEELRLAKYERRGSARCAFIYNACLCLCNSSPKRVLSKLNNTRGRRDNASLIWAHCRLPDGRSVQG